jgi:hypothetical protein
VDIITGLTTTLVEDMIRGPNQMTLDPVTQTILITSALAVSRFYPDSGLVETLAGSTKSGFADGHMKSLAFNSPYSIVYFSENITLVADSGNHVTRVLNFATQTVSSVCTPGSSGTEDGSATNCKLQNPLGLLYSEGLLYIGQYQAIRTIPGKSSTTISSYITRCSR